MTSTSGSANTATLSILPFLFLLMLKALTPIALGRSLRATLLLLPFVYVIFDLLENSLVLVLLANYPERLDLLAVSLPYTTIIKTVASLLATGASVVMLALDALRRFQRAKIHL